MLKQLSIFTKNCHGSLLKITGILKDHDINILGSVTNDSAEYGIIRMVVSDPDKAQQVFSDAGYMCCLTDVIGILVPDEVGSLNSLLASLNESNIDLDYIYLSFDRNSASPIMIFHASDIYEVENCLVLKGYTALDQAEAF